MNFEQNIHHYVKKNRIFKNTLNCSYSKVEQDEYKVKNSVALEPGKL